MGATAIQVPFGGRFEGLSKAGKTLVDAII
jgi:hypothetical protein